jgi:Cu/Ag efflux protein CusF
MNCRICLIVWLICSVALFAQTDSAPSLIPFTKGVLEKVNLANKQLVVRVEQSSHTFQWTDRTYVFRGKEKISPAQLKTNDVVALRVDRGPGGQLMIRRMKTYPAP